MPQSPTPSKHPSSAPSGARSAPVPLAVRAISLTRGRLPAALLGLIPLFAGCGDGQGAAAADPAPSRAVEPTGTEDSDVEALIAAFVPLEAHVTSDRHDRWLGTQRALLTELKARSTPALAERALQAFEADPPHPDGVRVALLEVAAHGLAGGASAAPVPGGGLDSMLEELIVTYDSGAGLRVRTEAVRILAESSPVRALEFFAPLLREDRPSSTRPPQSALVEGWLVAARSLAGSAASPETVDTRVLADVATNIFQPPDARYVAIEGLGELGGDLAGVALEEILMESSSDGYVRRKAAQALVRAVEPETLCPLIARLASHESDPHFLNFLADMLESNCAGIDVTTGHEGHDH